MGQVSPQKKILYQAAGYAVLAALFNAIMAALIKIEVMKGVKPPILIFWRSFFGLLMIVPQLHFFSRQIPLFEKLKTKHWGLLCIRGVTGFASFYFFFYSLKKLTLADATLLFFTFPLFMPFVAWAWKRIPFPKIEWLGLSLGFLGVILVVKPGADLLQSAAFIGLLAGIIYTVGQFSVYLLTLTDSYRNINFYYYVILCLLSFPLTFLDGAWAGLNWRDYAIFFGIGIFGFGYLVAITHALKMGHPNPVTSCLYTTVVFAMILDWVIWRDITHWISVTGAILIFVGVLLKLYWHKHAPSK